MVKKALEGLTGVKQAEVSFSTKQAIVRYEPARVGIAAMLAAVKQAGFAARLRP